MSASAGGRFVATAAYGSRSHPDVVALRRFRDEVLVRSAPGRAFVAAYRVLGPRMAGSSPRGRLRPQGARGDRAARAPRRPAGGTGRSSRDSVREGPDGHGGHAVARSGTRAQLVK